MSDTSAAYHGKRGDVSRWLRDRVVESMFPGRDGRTRNELQTDVHSAIVLSGPRHTEHGLYSSATQG